MTGPTRIPFRFVMALTMASAALAGNPLQPTARITPADYRAAETLLEGNLQGLVTNERVSPRWLGDSGRFWYTRDTADGVRYVVVEPKRQSREAAFDHKALAVALGRVLEKEITAHGLGLQSVSLDESLTELRAVLDDKAATCDLEAMRCETQAHERPPKDALVSNTGKYRLRSVDHNFLLENTDSSEQRQLTGDGEPYRAWGKLPDTSLITIQIKKHDMKLPPHGAQFSPDDRYLVASLTDERAVRVNPFVEWVPTDGTLRPVVHEVRQPFTGDPEMPETELFVFDLASGERRRVDIPEGYGLGGLEGNVLDWSAGRGQAFVLVRTLGSKQVALLRVDLASGRSKTVIKEKADTTVQTNSVEYNRANIRILGDGDEVVWYSDRSGWGHLYL